MICFETYHIDSSYILGEPTPFHRWLLFLSELTSTLNTTMQVSNLFEIILHSSFADDTQLPLGQTKDLVLDSPQLLFIDDFFSEWVFDFFIDDFRPTRLKWLNLKPFHVMVFWPYEWTPGFFWGIPTPGSGYALILFMDASRLLCWLILHHFHDEPRIFS